MTVIRIPLNREQLEAKRIDADKAGVPVTGDKGSGNAHGVKYDYEYADNQLVVTIEHVSLGDKIAGYNEQKIAELLKEKLSA